jgi:hypothetical protein
MRVTIELSGEANARLNAEAARRGITLDQLIAQLAERIAAQPTKTPRPKLAFVGAAESRAGVIHQINELLEDGFGRD